MYIYLTFDNYQFQRTSYKNFENFLPFFGEVPNLLIWMTNFKIHKLQTLSIMASFLSKVLIWADYFNRAKRKVFVEIMLRVVKIREEHYFSFKIGRSVEEVFIS